MKAYALSVLSMAAIAGLAFAMPMSSNAAGFGAAAGVGKTLIPSVNLTACTGSIEPAQKIWLAGACNGPSGGGGGGSGKKPGGGLQSAPQP